MSILYNWAIVKMFFHLNNRIWISFIYAPQADAAETIDKRQYRKNTKQFLQNKLIFTFKNQFHSKQLIGFELEFMATLLPEAL